MPNDARLGLVVGVALVLITAVVFFRQDAPAGPVGAAPPAVTQGEEETHRRGAEGTERRRAEGD